MKQGTTNVVFGQLAESILRDALAVRGEHEEVVVFPDDLSFGPIDVLTGPGRQQWISDNFHLRSDEWGVFPLELEMFFQSVNAQNNKIICWVCKNAVDELCGFCALVDNFNGVSLFAIETTTFGSDQFDCGKAQDEAIALKLAHVSPAIASKLLGTETAVSLAQRAELVAVWRRVQLENAAFRAIDVDGLKSVPPSYFDAFLLNRVEAQWQPAPRVVTFAAADADQGKFFRVTMVALAGRLLELANTGRIKIRGDRSNWATIQVCLP